MSLCDMSTGDSLRWHEGMKFSTKDRENDLHATKWCARSFPGGWWYNKCLVSNLNGLYYSEGETPLTAQGVDWYYWKGHDYSLKSTEMKFKPYGI